MNIFISGGCKNGKSYYAQRKVHDLAKASGKPLYYIATMLPHDEEDHKRIRRHLSEREGWGFETIEQGKNILEITGNLEVDLEGSFLLDSVTAIMENEMFIRKGEEIVYDETAADRVRNEMLAFAEAVAAKGGSVVFVSDGIYGDLGEYNEATELYRRALAGTDLALAKACECVLEIAYGNAEIWKQKA